MERLTPAERACAVAAAAAHDLNNELTVILSGVSHALEAVECNHPARRLLLDSLAAAQRCVGRSTGLLEFSARSLPRPVRASFDRLTEL